MTATPLVRTAPTGTTGIRVTQARVIHSEWIKFRSVRSSLWTLAAGVVLLVGLSALIGSVTMSQWDSLDEATRASLDPVALATSGSTFAQLATGVLAVLMITGEYTTGMIRASLTVVPRRLPVLWAKLAVFSAVTFVVTLISSFAAFFVSQAVVSGHGLSVPITDGDALRAVFGLAFYLTVAGIVAMALGALLRTTAAGISTLVAVFLVIPPLVSLLPASVSGDLVKYLPSSAGQAMFGTGGGDGSLSPGTGALVFCAYAVVLVAVAAWRLRRTDV
ncbi:ABC transporter permease subunit [Kineosporia sp. J2-2]|uniref:ABC transporter permease subunit n=1 Tax=Kineosporia corallincola TaxID=2835133 RepID=A0ABS5TN98_9ACTN|nr:ABC transporter permease subunit [Kineosporia corallincola]MBT0771854.1 ABC transporter permease subunit [Kineosporia corallincola]